MKKSSFIALLLGAVSLLLFALGMCMALLSEWDLFQPGLAFGGVGILLGLVTVLVWRKMTRKPPLHLIGKVVGTALLGILGVLALGVGMCCTMVWEQMLVGILVGALGILLLLCLIPLCRGLKN